MNRDNQPVFNVNRKVANYKDFSADVEKEKLGKVRRSFQPNSDRQNFPSNDRNEFDPITRKITQVTLPEVEDKLKSLEETNEGVSDDISKLIKRKLDGKNLSQKDFLKLHNWMMENDEDYCKSVDKQMSKDLKKLVPKNTEIKNEGVFSDEGHAGMNGERYIEKKYYSEEEVIQLLIKFNQEIQEVEDVREWFEEFKK
jgi:hypothetical protein